MRKTKIFGVWILLAAIMLLLLPLRADAAVKTYTVRFREQDGTLIASKTVAKNEMIRLPSMPYRADEAPVGWCTTKGKTSPTKIVGLQVRITKTTTFYAVRKKNYSIVSYYSNDGKRKISDVKVTNGSSTKALAEKSPYGYTFMGWSTSKNQKAKPKYEPNQSFTVNKNIKLYEVLYSTNGEKSVTAKTFKGTSRYSKIIFVGDSRTVHMSNVVTGAKRNNVSFIAEVGSGISWMKGTAKDRLMNEIANSRSSKKIAVVFNHGINDIANYNVATTYANYFNSLGDVLKSKNCDVFYMSVNPANSVTWSLLKDDLVRDFNAKMKSSLRGFRWIDSYSYLMKNGFALTDGLHYSAKTSAKIFNYCVSEVSKVKK